MAAGKKVWGVLTAITLLGSLLLMMGLSLECCGAAAVDRENRVTVGYKPPVVDDLAA